MSIYTSVHFDPQEESLGGNSAGIQEGEFGKVHVLELGRATIFVRDEDLADFKALVAEMK